MLRIFRLRHQNCSRFAVLEQDTYRLVAGDALAGDWHLGEERIPVGEAVLLTPVVPTKIVAVGLNYRSHANEMCMDLPSEPLIFFKPTTALAASGEPIRLPAMSRQVEFEGELALVIGRSGRRIPESRALEWLLGCTLANDVTARDLQKRDGQWARAKGFDGFCPLGPCLATGLNPDRLELRTRVNGELKQTGKTSDFIFSAARVISFVSEIMTLSPGDVILTGTPPGVGPLAAGDRVRVECDAIGILENPVEKDFPER